MKDFEQKQELLHDVYGLSQQDSYRIFHYVMAVARKMREGKAILNNFDLTKEILNSKVFESENEKLYAHHLIGRMFGTEEKENEEETRRVIVTTLKTGTFTS
jgi:hypothetical protein